MKDYSKYTDQEVWSFLRQGEEAALAHLFRNYYGMICGVAYRMIGDKQMAEDLGQEVFFDLWKKRGQLMVQTSLGAYLRKSISNKTLNYIRDQKIKFDGDEKIVEIEQSGGTAQQTMESAEMQVKIKAAIQALPERCRMVFVLSRYQGLSYAEIANNLDISVKTVENQISKALKLLKERLRPFVGCLLILFNQCFF